MHQNIKEYNEVFLIVDHSKIQLKHWAAFEIPIQSHCIFLLVRILLNFKNFKMKNIDRKVSQTEVQNKKLVII